MHSTYQSLWLRVAGAAFALSAMTAHATEEAPASRAPVVSLSASAQAQVPADEMVIVLRTQRDGQKLGALNQAVLAELNKALAQAKAASGVKARLGSVQTHQTFSDKGKPNGWQVQGSLVLESQNLKELGELAGTMSEQLQLAQVSFRLSRERRESEEQRLLKEAAQAFGARAQASALALGYNGYTLKEVSVSQSGGPRPPVMPMYAARSMVADAAAHVPTEGGDVDVNVSLSGSVTLTR